MSTQTGNLGLTKPAASENVSLTVLNGNLDLLDAQFQEGTWTPRVYDYVDGSDVYRFEMPSQSYWKIGKLYVMRISANNVDISGVTTLMKILNLPCTAVIGAGQIYINTASGSTYGAAHTVQGSGSGVVFRPALKGTDVAGGSIGVFQMLIFGI